MLEIRICKCGCGETFECQKYKRTRYIGHHYQKFAHIQRGKTWEEIYGIEGAKIFREKRRQTRLGRKLNRIKPSYKKGKTYEEIYGKKKSKEIIQKYLNNRQDIWTKEKIIKAYQIIPDIRRSEWNYYRKEGLLPDANTVRKFFKNFNVLEIESKKHFLDGVLLEHRRMEGGYEKIILDNIEKELNIKLIRQFKVNVGRRNFYVDGYDILNNVAYEIDESYHKYGKYKIFDCIREKKIKDILKCQFIRIDEQTYLMEKQILEKWIMR
jgi:hypothetical protein